MITINTGTSVFAAIEEIASTPSKLEKDALLKAAGSSSSLFLQSLRYAYDPFKNYGIANAPKKTPGVAPGTNTLAEPFVWATLDGLAKRELSGNAARDKVQQVVDFLDDASSEVFRRIVNKDMRAGFSEGTINKAFKGAIPEFPYMRCSLPDKSNMGKWQWEDGIIVQEKADGMFANVNHDATGFVWVTSRSGSPFPADSLGIEGAVREFVTRGTQTHGELTVYADGELMPREKGNGILNSLLSGGALDANMHVVLEVWDQIPLESVKPKGKYERHYRQRLASLVEQCARSKGKGALAQVRLIPTKLVKSKAEAYDYYRQMLKKKKEGVVCKSPLAFWSDSTSKDQVKLKVEVDVDLEIVGIVLGKEGGKNEGKPGSLSCRSSCGQLVVDVTVKNDAIRDSVENWIGNIIVVRSNSILQPSESSENHSLFLPRMVEADYRRDKTVADSLEEITAQFAAAVGAV